MSFTLKRKNALELPDNHPLKAVIAGEYNYNPRSGVSNVGTGEQHDYTYLPPEKIEDILGEVANHNSPIGLYKSMESRTEGDYLLYSIVDLAEKLREKYKEDLSSRVSESEDWNEEEDETEMDEIRLVQSIIEVADNPAEGYPMVEIWW